MISNKRVLPNFLKTILFAAAALTSVSAFAGHHEKGEKIGELKDMNKKTKALKHDEMKTSLTDDAADVKIDAMDAKDKAADDAEAVKIEVPQG